MTNLETIIILINWKKPVLTRQCLLSLQQSSYGKFEVILVENGSFKWKAFVKKLNFKTHIIISKKNKGVAATRNLAIKKALGKKAEFIWILDNDVLVKPDALKEMIKVLKESSQVGLLGNVITFAGTDKIYFAGGKFKYFLNLFLFFNNLYRKTDKKNLPFKNELKKVDYLIGCSMFIRSKVFRKIGLFDEDYRVYGVEDLDFCFRASKLGIYVYGKNLVEHKKNISGNSRFQDKINSQQAYFLAQNNLKFILKNMVGIKIVLNLLLIYFFKSAWYLFICENCKARLNYLKGLVSINMFKNYKIKNDNYK